MDGSSWRRRAGEHADALGAFDDPELERWRQWVRVRAGIHASIEAAEAALVEAEAWAARSGHAAAHAGVAGWKVSVSESLAIARG